jgi:hypothetical protein
VTSHYLVFKRHLTILKVYFRYSHGRTAETNRNFTYESLSSVVTRTAFFSLCESDSLSLWQPANSPLCLLLSPYGFLLQFYSCIRSDDLGPMREGATARWRHLHNYEHVICAVDRTWLWESNLVDNWDVAGWTPRDSRIAVKEIKFSARTEIEPVATELLLLRPLRVHTILLTDLKETGCEVVYWNSVAKEKVQHRGLRNIENRPASIIARGIFWPGVRMTAYQDSSPCCGLVTVDKETLQDCVSVPSRKTKLKQVRRWRKNELLCCSRMTVVNYVNTKQRLYFLNFRFVV